MIDVALPYLRGKLNECRDDPSHFADCFLSKEEDRTFEGPDGRNRVFWKRQRQMSQSVVDYRTTVIYSGNAIGKDFWVGRLVWWWLCTHKDALVIVTGPTQTLIGTVTWKEIRRAIRHAPVPFNFKISQGAKNSPQTIEIAPGWQALGYSTTNVERQSGQHAEHLLVIVEEASGVEDEIWDAIESLGYSRLIAIGNPIRAEGRFVELIRQADRDRNDGLDPRFSVNAIQIPSTDSPHANDEKSSFGLADRTWLDSVARRYGKESLWYKSHVLAIIPAISSDILIPIGWFDFAVAAIRQDAHTMHPVHATRRLACDLSEGVGRDSSCVLVRDNWGVRECVWGSQLGLEEAAAIMYKLGSKWKVPARRMSFDKLGIGKNFPNHLAKFRDHLGESLAMAQPYVGSGDPREKQFVNLRTEAAWNLRCRLNMEHVPDIRTPHLTQTPFTFVAGNYLERLRAEIEPLTYELKLQKTKLMDKKDWSEILGHSPDIADTLIQSFAFG